MIVDWKSDAALRTYNALRAANPHLPDPEYVTLDEITLNMGGQSALASLSLRVFVALPEEWATGSGDWTIRHD